MIIFLSRYGILHREKFTKCQTRFFRQFIYPFRSKTKRQIIWMCIYWFLRIIMTIISIFLIRKRQPSINETTDSINTDQIIDNELSIENDNEMQMLDLARIYIEMGSYDEAKGILDQLISNSNNLQIQADASLLKNKLEN